MRVINNTTWRTDQLKAIIQRCAEQEFDDGARRKRLVVTVVYTRNGGCSGYAWLNSNHCTVRIAGTVETVDPAVGDRLRVARRDAVSTPLLRQQFASVVCHEFAHCRGMSHRQMPKYYSWADGWDRYVAWAADMPLERKPAVVHEKPTIDAKLTHVQRMLVRAETRAKRANTILKKWQRKQRYYERQAAARATK